MPERIQLRRTKGWRKPEGAIVVSRPSRWGNPFTVERFMGGWSVDDLGGWSVDDPFAAHYGVWETETAARAEAVRLYRELWLGAAIGLAVVQSELAGHDLACWCPLVDAEGNRVPCHADVLLEVANA